MASQNNSIVFFGTPDFARISLEHLHRAGFPIGAVVTQPDKPSGRGQKLHPSPVKSLAQQYQWEIFQPQNLKHLTHDGSSLHVTAREGTFSDPELVSLVNYLNSLQSPLTVVVVAYGKLIPSALISFAKKRIVNVHASLLPRWRGAAPIHHALLAGDNETGVCIMQIDEGLDSGPVYARTSTTIEPSDDFGSLHDRLANLGSALLVETLPKIINGTISPVAQSEDGVTMAPRLEKADFELCWSESAKALVRRIKAFSPHPGARTTFNNTLIKVLDAHEATNETFIPGPPGAIVFASTSKLVIAAGNGFVELDRLQFPGKKPMPISQILNGKTFAIGETFR